MRTKKSTIDARGLIVSEVETVYITKIKNSELKKITKSSECANIFRSIPEYAENIDYCEYFYAMYLNRANAVLAVMKISMGSSTGSIVNIQKIIKSALDFNAKSVVISHNHPSGNLTASNEDINVTKKIKNALSFFEMNLLDHIILSSESYYSFVDNGEI
jgi:DNA repair protein RadC